MPALRMPYGQGVVDVSDDAAAAYLAQGWVKVGETANVPSAPLDPPAKAGPGSSLKAWLKYKLDLGIAEPDDSTLSRDELIDKIEAAGFPVE